MTERRELTKKRLVWRSEHDGSKHTIDVLVKKENDVWIPYKYDEPDFGGKGWVPDKQIIDMLSKKERWGVEDI